jgi:hypothetical protein
MRRPNIPQPRIPRPPSTRLLVRRQPNVLRPLTKLRRDPRQVVKLRGPVPRPQKAAKRRRREPRRVPVPLRVAPLLVRRRGQQPLNAVDPPKMKNAGDLNDECVKHSCLMSQPRAVPVGGGSWRCQIFANGSLTAGRNMAIMFLRVFATSMPLRSRSLEKR